MESSALLSSHFVLSSLSSSKSSLLSTSPSSSDRGLRKILMNRWNITRAPVFTRMVVLLLALSLQVQGLDGANTQSDFDNQRDRINQAHTACNDTITASQKPNDEGLYCEPIWDNVMCWPDYIPAGQLAQQPCAEYIDGFNPDEKAHRFCMSDGTWAIHPDVNINTSWTNFLDCTKPHEVSTIHPKLAHHMPKITLISTVGYSISLVFLMVAIILMVGLKKLHCQRNTIHINLFLSFVFRAAISLVRNGALVKGFAFSWDFDYDEDGTVVFIEEKTHWECKLLNVLHHYALCANYSWIFVEGLYLHTLIFFAVFSQSKKYFKVYILIGWSFPLIFVIIWIFSRIYKNDILCWNTHEKNYYWILEAPIIASILVNFFFFLNIIRVLFTKIRNCNSRDPRRFRKLAKSTLVLIPLFGVYYIIFIILARHRRPDIAVVHMYLEMTLNSFQGIVVAFLFCFMNEEVRAEVAKKWNRHKLTRRYSTTSRRSSHAFSTSSFILRERFSLPQIGSTNSDSNGKAHFTSSNKPVFEKAAENNAIIETIPRVPSQSKVTFNFLNNIDHQNGLPTPNDESHPQNGINKNGPVSSSSEDNNTSYPPESDKDFNCELHQLLSAKISEDHNLNYETNSKNPPDVDGCKNKYDRFDEQPLIQLHNSPLSAPAPFPSSNSLSLVKDPTYLLQQVGAKRI